MKSVGKIVALAGVFSGLMAPALAADPIDDFVRTELETNQIPGVALLVLRDGVIVKQQGYGFANLEHRVPVTPDTIFQSGSTGKQFTAAGILLLAEDGELDLDDRLAMYFPDAPAAWHRITVRQLLTHTSRIKDYADEFDYRRDYTDEEMLAVMQQLPLEFEPGTQWSYSNSGYLILGLLTTKVAGKHWSEFQSERLFAPLGMRTTRLISERDVIPNRAAGYQLDGNGAIVNQDWVAPGFNRCADGALYFSIRDLAAWHKALDAAEFLAPESLSAWWRPVRVANGTNYPYGFGWDLAEQRGAALLEHGGSWQGFRAAIARYPEQHLAIAVLANAAQAQTEAIAHAIAGLVEASLERRALDAQPVETDPSLTRSWRGVLDAWATFRTVPAMSAGLAATASGSAREADDRRALESALKTARSFHVIGTDRLTRAAVELLDDGSVTAVDAVLETDTARLPVRFRLDAKGRVVTFSFSEQ
jgi:CubicO group peptidase (beta-lactamase class C family)